MKRPALNQTALGRALGLSPAAITKLKGMGMPVHSVAAARAWRTRNINIAATKRQRPGQTRSTARFADARAERAVLEAEAARLALLERKGMLVPRDKVRRELARRLATLREALLQMPVRLQAVLAQETDEAKVHELMRQEVSLLAERITELA